MPWAGIGRATVYLLVITLIYLAFRAAELWSGSDDLHGAYRALVHMEAFWVAGWLIFRRWS